MFVNKWTLQVTSTKIKRILTPPCLSSTASQLPLARDNYYPDFCVNHLLFFIVLTYLSQATVPVSELAPVTSKISSRLHRFPPHQCDMWLCKSTNTRSENHWGPFWKLTTHYSLYVFRSEQKWKAIFHFNLKIQKIIWKSLNFLLKIKKNQSKSWYLKIPPSSY